MPAMRRVRSFWRWKRNRIANLGIVLLIAIGRAQAVCGEPQSDSIGASDPVDKVAAAVQRTVEEPPVVTCIAARPDGRGLATGGDDHVIRIWDPDGPKLLRELHGHTDWVRGLRFDPHDGHLLSAGADGRILRWNPESPEAPITIHRQTKGIDALAILPNRRLAFGGFNQPLSVIALDAPHDVSHLSGSGRDTRVIAVAPQGNWLAAGGQDGVVRIWKIHATGCEFSRDVAAHQQRLRALVFSQDGTRLVTGGEDRMIRVWDVVRGTEATSALRTPGKVLALAMLDDNRIAAAGADNRIAVLDLRSGTEVHTLTGHTGSVSVLMPWEGKLVSGGYDASVRIWERAAWEQGGMRSGTLSAIVPGAAAARVER